MSIQPRPSPTRPLDLGHLTYRQQLILGSTTTSLILAIGSYGLRLYVKRKIVARIWWDDYTIGVGLAFATVPCISNYVGLTYGFGLHADTLPEECPRKYFQCLYALLLGWIISETIIKFGILLFYWRVFRGRYFRWSVWVVGTFFVACFMAGFFGFILQCVPVNGFWDRSEHAMCLKESPFFHATAALDLFGDIILFIQPLPIILRLKASRETRLGLCVVFLTGGLVIFISAFRLAAIKRIDPVDITWSNVGPAIWTSAEVTMGVVSANLPLMRPLLSDLRDKITILRGFCSGPSKSQALSAAQDHQTLRTRYMTRMLAHDQKEPSTMGLTSTAEHRPDDDAMGCDFVRPIHGITVRTDLEFQVEDLREEEEMRRLEPVVLGGMPRAPRKTIGWAGVCPIRSREAKAAGKDRA